MELCSEMVVFFLTFGVVGDNMFDVVVVGEGTSFLS